MAATGGRTSASLSEQLRRQSHRFDFFQAVRLLEREAGERLSQQTGRPRHSVGRDGSPREEVVRFHALPSHSFPASSISEVRDSADPAGTGGEVGPVEMLVAFMGLTGPNGVLPPHYTSLLIERVRGKDFALRDFLDLFNHRAISLFYRAWEKYRFQIVYERAKSAAGEDAEDLLTDCLFCLLGLGLESGKMRGRMQFDDEAFLFYGGYFAHRPRSAVALESMLADYFGLPLEIKQFVGQWLYLSEEDQSALPSPRRPRGLNTALGLNVVAGERVWGVESRFRIRFGPLGYREFCRFLPSGDALRPVCQMVRSYVGPEFDFDVQPVLRAEEVPWCRLGGEEDPPPRLGWNTWIRSGALRQDVSDAVFSLEGLP
jgi:type VI secretion system protein ImpH